MEKFKLKNNIKVAVERNQNNQNVALCLNFSFPEEGNFPGIWDFVSRLLQRELQIRLQEEFSQNPDKNAIEISCKAERDFLSASLSCPKEDLNCAVELLSNVIKISLIISPAEFAKEKNNIRKALMAGLEDNRTEVFDNYYKNLFEGSFYEKSYTKMIETLERITKEDVENAYVKVITKSKKVLSIVGDVDIEQTRMLLDKCLGTIENEDLEEKDFAIPYLRENKTVEIVKKDAPKALVVKGWVFPTFSSEDYAALVVLNSLLGSDSLCSRLFLELRGKQDIVYAIRSSYDAYKHGASFSIYIATDTENIQEVLVGVDSELSKLKQEGVDEVELEYGKKILLSKYKKITENNVLLANQLAHDETMGFEFQEKLVEKIKKVTAKEIQDCANKYLDDKFVVSVLRSESN